MPRGRAAGGGRRAGGDTVLLAPAAASMDQFTDYADRGTRSPRRCASGSSEASDGRRVRLTQVAARPHGEVLSPRPASTGSRARVRLGTRLRAPVSAEFVLLASAPRLFLTVFGLVMVLSSSSVESGDTGQRTVRRSSSSQGDRRAIGVPLMFVVAAFPVPVLEARGLARADRRRRPAAAGAITPLGMGERRQPELAQDRRAQRVSRPSSSSSPSCLGRDSPVAQAGAARPLAARGHSRSCPVGGPGDRARSARRRPRHDSMIMCLVCCSALCSSPACGCGFILPLLVSRVAVLGLSRSPDERAPAAIAGRVRLQQRHQLLSTTCYQQMHAIWALANGGIFGVGTRQLAREVVWLPAADNDFIFAIIGEELGLIGARSCSACSCCSRSPCSAIDPHAATDPFARVTTGGDRGVAHRPGVRQHRASCSASCPVLGVPLPLISAGGTALICPCSRVGCVLSFAPARCRRAPARRRITAGRSGTSAGDPLSAGRRRDRRPRQPAARRRRPAARATTRGRGARARHRGGAGGAAGAASAGYELLAIPKLPVPAAPERAPPCASRAVPRVRSRRPSQLPRASTASTASSASAATPRRPPTRRRAARGIPFVVHEENAKPGLANRLGARTRRAVGVAFPGTPLPHAHLRRHAAAPRDRRPRPRGAARRGGRAQFGLDPDRPVLLVTGGSLGAQRLNEAIAGSLRSVLDAGWQVLHLHRRPRRAPDPRLPGYRAARLLRPDGPRASRSPTGRCPARRRRHRQRARGARPSRGLRAVRGRQRRAAAQRGRGVDAGGAILDRGRDLDRRSGPQRAASAARRRGPHREPWPGRGAHRIRTGTEDLIALTDARSPAEPRAGSRPGVPGPWPRRHRLRMHSVMIKPDLTLPIPDHLDRCALRRHRRIGHERARPAVPRRRHPVTGSDRADSANLRALAALGADRADRARRGERGRRRHPRASPARSGRTTRSSSSPRSAACRCCTVPRRCLADRRTTAGLGRRRARQDHVHRHDRHRAARARRRPELRQRRRDRTARRVSSHGRRRPVRGRGRRVRRLLPALRHRRSP